MRVKVIAIPCNLNASKLLKKLIVLNMITEKHLLRELSSDFLSWKSNNDQTDNAFCWNDRNQFTTNLITKTYTWLSTKHRYTIFLYKLLGREKW